MRVIIPEPITDQNLISSNVPENDAPDYSSGATYGAGEAVMLDHVVYQAAADGVSGVDPKTDDGTSWIPLGSTRRWRPFDGVIADPVTVTSSTLVYRFAPQSLARGVALFGLVADRVDVTVSHGENSVVFRKELISFDHIDGWWSWLFVEPTREAECVFLDLPWFGAGTEIEVKVISHSGNVAAGQIVMGDVQRVGQTRWGAEIGLLSSSRKERDQYGRWVIVKRYTSRTARLPVMVRGKSPRAVQKMFAALDALPAVFVGDERGEFGLILFGLYLEYNTTLAGDGWSEVMIYVESIQ